MTDVNKNENQMETIKKNDRIMNVLIVDNDMGLMNELKDWVKKSEIETKYGLSFKYAKDGIECLKRLNEMEINLVVMEIALPIISGYYLIDVIKAEKKDLPIMIYTKLKNPQDLAKMASLNINNIFLKELMDIQDLVQIIRKKETGADIDAIVMELNSQIKSLHGAETKHELKLIQCPRCHLILAPDSHFCNNCGQKIFKKTKALLKKETEKQNKKKKEVEIEFPSKKEEEKTETETETKTPEAPKEEKKPEAPKEEVTEVKTEVIPQ